MTPRRHEDQLRARPAGEEASPPTRSDQHPVAGDLSPQPGQSQLPPPRL